MSTRYVAIVARVLALILIILIVSNLNQNEGWRGFVVIWLSCLSGLLLNQLFTEALPNPHTNEKERS